MSLKRFSSGVVKSSDTEDESSEEDALAMLERKANPAMKSRRIQRPKPLPVKKEVEKPAAKFDLGKLLKMKQKDEATLAKVKEADSAIAKANEKMAEEDEETILQRMDPALKNVLKRKGGSEKDSYGDKMEWKFFGGRCSTGHIEQAVEQYQTSRQLSCPEWLRDFENDPLVREQMLLSGFAEEMALHDEQTPLGVASMALEKSLEEPREDFSASYYYVYEKCQNTDYMVEEDDIKGIVSKFAATVDRINLKAKIQPELPQKKVKSRDNYKAYWKERLMCNDIFTTAIACGKEATFDTTAYAAGILLRALLDAENYESAILACEIRTTFAEIIDKFNENEWATLEDRIIRDFASSCADIYYHSRAVVNIPVTTSRAYFFRRKLASSLLFHPKPPQPLTTKVVLSFIQIGQPGDSVEVETKTLRDTKGRLILVDVLLDETEVKTRKERDSWVDCIARLHTMMKDKPGSSSMKTETKDLFDQMKLRLEYMSGWSTKGQMRLDDYIS